MRCHYVWDEESKQKVLIPGCMAVAVSGDIEDCNCNSMPQTFENFQKIEFNKAIKEKDKQIKELNEEVECLHKELEYHVKMLEKIKSSNLNE